MSEPVKSEPRIKRPVVSDRDGTREGGLVFCIAVIGGMILAASVSAVALTSFWVWFALLLAAVGVATSTQRLVLYLNGESEGRAKENGANPEHWAQK